ncbi:Asp23/Gls24 family envelope stress response protein [Enemella evansiae]|nr:Asp23/Gls24 family envelope stress response protein [Enemella evansiae]PFG68952.1 putative alkaline shock family protein YloU [Propionibacteriaceae bacterium ES.041]TDO89687.1 putative alkaline shock family protein YloU [Enemella evansiae]
MNSRSSGVLMDTRTEATTPTPRRAAPEEQRGSTNIPAKVVAKIAEQVAAEVSNVGAAAGGVLGVGARRDFDARPTVECELYGHVAVLRMDVGMAFPTNLVAAARSLREHVRDRVEYLTGLEVGRLDIQISWLNPESRVRSELR